MVKRMMWRGVMAIAIALLAAPFATRASTSGNALVKWNTVPVVKVILTPNYALGFGQVIATFGPQPTPTSGPDASYQAGAVDFGDVFSGASYLYKYAAHLNVTTNSATGFNVYGEGAADFYNSTDSTSQLISQTLYWVTSTSGSPPDPNNGYTPGLPFYKTSGTVSPAQPNFLTPPTISYTTYPAPISSANTKDGDFYYDYELKVPSMATNGAYYVWVVYTVVIK